MATSDSAMIVLARGGSKGLPGKNMLRLGAEPLVARAVRIAIESQCFDRVIVSSDDQVILNAAESSGGEPHRRSEETSSDLATSEESLLEVLSDCRVTNERCFLRQCTTPFISEKDLSNISGMCLEFPEDTIVTGYVESMHHWIALAGMDSLIPIKKFEKLRRPRQQLRESVFVENGGVYSFPVDAFLRKKNRFIGNVIPYVMDKWCSVDIDVAADLEIARVFEEHLKM